MRAHYRSHTKTKPFKCGFSFCGEQYVTMRSFLKHILRAHQVESAEEARKYLIELKELLEEESKQLNIRNVFTGKVFGEEVQVSEEDDDNAQAERLPILPHFTKIHRTSTGHFICPFSQCNQQSISLIDLKVHYRMHCGSAFRPFRCTYPDSCRYASRLRQHLERHIREKHFRISRDVKECNEDEDRNEADFIDTCEDLLKLEDALFAKAKIVNPPRFAKPRPHACTFPDCTKTYTILHNLRRHLRAHSTVKPFRCAYPGCSHTSPRSENILSHVLSLHFKIPEKKHRKVGDEVRLRAKQYAEATEEVLADKEVQVALAQIGPKRKKVTRSRPPSNTGSYECLKYCEVRLDEVSTTPLPHCLTPQRLEAVNKPRSSKSGRCFEVDL